MLAAAASRVAQGVRRAIAPGAGVAASSAVAWSVWRDLHRARTVVRLDPPVTRIGLDVSPSDGVDDAPPVHLLALGDSSIAGVGAERVGDCLAVQIAARVADRTGRSVRVAGHGVSGARTGDVLADQVRTVEPDDPPDVVVVVVGANDVVHLTPPRQYARDVDRLYGALAERVDGPIIACSLPEIRAITLVGHPLRDAATAYGRMLGVVQRRVLARHPAVTLVDARRTAGPDFLRRPEAMAVDGFHPSGIGYALLADALAPSVSGALAADR